MHSGGRILRAERTERCSLPTSRGGAQGGRTDDLVQRVRCFERHVEIPMPAYDGGPSWCLRQSSGASSRGAS